MKKAIHILTIFFLFLSQLQAQEKATLKEQALEEFKKEHYNEAIAVYISGDIAKKEQLRAFNGRTIQGIIRTRKF